MIIIQIALGIVLAFLILYFLPVLIGLGSIFVVIVILLVVGGFFLYWVGSSPAAIAFIAIFAIGIVLLRPLAKRFAANAPVRDLRGRIRQRQAIGYDTSDLEEELTKALSEASLVEKKGKLKSRRELGYTDDQDNA